MGPRRGQPQAPGIVRTGSDTGGEESGGDDGGEGDEDEDDDGMPGVMLIMKDMGFFI